MAHCRVAKTRQRIAENHDGVWWETPFSDLLYLPKRSHRRGLKSIESECKITKIKAVTRLYANANPTMVLAQRFEEKAERTGRRP